MIPFLCLLQEALKKGRNRMKKCFAKNNSFFAGLRKELQRNWILYLMIVPVLAYFIIFSYVPMYGVTLAFKKYNAKLGILGSPWVGLKYFQRFFTAYNFKQLITNTFTISAYYLLASFPLSIIFALCLNYVTNKPLKKTVQMVSYAPHFLSTVVLCSMVTLFMHKDTGIFNTLRNLVGLESVQFLAKPEWFKSIYVWSGVWQHMGFDSIIYISALAGVDYQMHEAAIIDGATKIQRMRYVDLPSIKPTIIMLLILKIGGLANVGFEKVFLLQNDLNKSASAIISTYTYEVGLINSDYSYSTAIGLFNTIINIVLLVSANAICKKVTDESLF